MNEIKKHALDSDMSEAGLNRRMKRLGNLHRLAQSLKTLRLSQCLRLLSANPRPPISPLQTMHNTEPTDFCP